MESATPTDTAHTGLFTYSPEGPTRFGAGSLLFDLSLDVDTEPTCRFWVDMTPRTFLALAPPLEYLDVPDEIPSLAAAGHVFAPARLQIDTDPDYGLDSYPVVMSHDGRHRMQALCGQGLEDVPLPVLICTGQTPCDWLVEEDIVRFRTAAWSQQSAVEKSVLLKGPLFGEALFKGAVLQAGIVDEIHDLLSPR